MKITTAISMLEVERWNMEILHAPSEAVDAIERVIDRVRRLENDTEARNKLGRVGRLVNRALDEADTDAFIYPVGEELYPVDVIVCSSCGHASWNAEMEGLQAVGDIDAKPGKINFCPHCGAAFANHVKKHAKLSEEGGGFGKCSHCGTDNLLLPAPKFCRECGYKFVNAGQVEPWECF